MESGGKLRLDVLLLGLLWLLVFQFVIGPFLGSVFPGVLGRPMGVEGVVEDDCPGCQAPDTVRGWVWLALFFPVAIVYHILYTVYVPDGGWRGLILRRL